TSFNTVTKVHTSALKCSPLAAMVARQAMQRTAKSRTAPGLEIPKMGAACSARPVMTAARLNNEEAYAIQPTKKAKRGPNAASAHTYGPPSTLNLPPSAA